MAPVVGNYVKHNASKPTVRLPGSSPNQSNEIGAPLFALGCAIVTKGLSVGIFQFNYHHFVSTHNGLSASTHFNPLSAAIICIDLSCSCFLAPPSSAPHNGRNRVDTAAQIDRFPLEFNRLRCAAFRCQTAAGRRHAKRWHIANQSTS